MVPSGYEPKSHEGMANPKWKGKLVGEPRDYQIFQALAEYKYKPVRRPVAREVDRRRVRV
jgi:hypothetical protein